MESTNLPEVDSVIYNRSVPLPRKTQLYLAGQSELPLAGTGTADCVVHSIVLISGLVNLLC